MSPHDFESHFLRLCTAHQGQNRALAFAFILFDTSHPHLRHVLEDDAYWESLDRISGRALTIFAFDVRPLPPPQPPRRGVPPRPGVIEMMIDIPSTGVAAHRDALSSYFPGLSMQQLPCILFFQVERETIVDAFAVKLSTASKNSAEAYNDLADVIHRAVNGLKNVEESNVGNTRELYQLVVEAMHDRKVKRGAAKVVRGIKAVLSLTSVVRLLVGLI